MPGIPNSLPCPKCAAICALDESERASGTFICPSCAHRVEELIVYWRVPAEEWRRYGRNYAGRMIMIGIAMLVVGVSCNLLFTGVLPFLGLVFTLMTLLGSVLVLGFIWTYLRNMRAEGDVYLYRWGVTCAYDDATWQLPGNEGGTRLAPFLVDVAFDTTGLVPLLTFKCGANLRDSTSVPVPSGKVEEGREVFYYFREMLDAA